jgi:hypothetical protein
LSKSGFFFLTWFFLLVAIVGLHEKLVNQLLSSKSAAPEDGIHPFAKTYGEAPPLVGVDINPGSDHNPAEYSDEEGYSSEEEEDNPQDDIAAGGSFELINKADIEQELYTSNPDLGV